MTRYDYYDGELHESEDEGAYTLYSEAEAELRRCRAETLREAMKLLKDSIQLSPVPVATREPYITGFGSAKLAAITDLRRMADEAEREARDE